MGLAMTVGGGLNAEELQNTVAEHGRQRLLGQFTSVRFWYYKQGKDTLKHFVSIFIKFNQTVSLSEGETQFG